MVKKVASLTGEIIAKKGEARPINSQSFRDNISLTVKLSKEEYKALRIYCAQDPKLTAQKVLRSAFIEWATINKIL